MNRFASLALLCCVLLLQACGSGPVKRVSEPGASIQQLTVRADGSWSVDLRVNNFSSVAMRFEGAELALEVGGQAAGTLRGQPQLTVGPEAADLVTLTLVPASAARIVVADALASRRSVAYTLKGRLDAAADGRGSRAFQVSHASSLTPAPGLPGVLR